MDYNILTIVLLSLHSASGILGSYIIDVQPMDPSVHEGSDVTLSCSSTIPGAVLTWLQVPESHLAFQTIRSSSFAGGSNLHLINGSRLPDESSSTISFLCMVNYNNEIHRKMSSVTIVPSSYPLEVQSGLVIFPSNPVAQNGTNYTITCLSPSDNRTDIGWYIPGDTITQFHSYEVEKFDNGAHLTIYLINADPNDPTISIVCLKTPSTPSTKAVTIQVVDYLLTTTESPLETKSPDHQQPTVAFTGTTFSQNSGGTDKSNLGIPITLVIIAIGIGSALAIFCIFFIFLSVYMIFLFRSQSLELLGKESSDDVFKTSPRVVDNHHPYQSVGDKDAEAAAAARDGVKQAKDGYADLRQYEEARVYMRLESKSSSKPTAAAARLEVHTTDGIYEGDIPGVQMTSFRQERSSQV
ncbi:hypothetical protein BSL78_08033 [Apostichopus japonicus]|uniref:Ig-like domain-containing protein n=1 Tax=Stichopus japonicus TaxID=307972 RepID=A0A2G8L491_STIJA|nr:hypothetical protein BSL78_08033 [Apostichopus japonicus]